MYFFISKISRTSTNHALWILVDIDFNINYFNSLVDIFVLKRTNQNLNNNVTACA